MAWWSDWFRPMAGPQPKQQILPLEEPARLSGTAKASGAAGTAATVALILALIFGGEGGYVNDPNDPGGETNWGCTVAVARANGYTASPCWPTRLSSRA